jgi:hypothetical protein
MARLVKGIAGTLIFHSNAVHCAKVIFGSTPGNARG